MSLSLRALAVATAFAGLSATTNAEEGGRADGSRGGGWSERGERGSGMIDPERRIEAIDRAVGGLNAEQKETIRGIMASARAKMEALREEAGDARREKGRAIMEASREEIRAVLSAEQKTKFDEMAKRRPGPGAERNRGARRPKVERP